MKNLSIGVYDKDKVDKRNTFLVGSVVAGSRKLAVVEGEGNLLNLKSCDIVVCHAESCVGQSRHDCWEALVEQSLANSVRIRTSTEPSWNKCFEQTANGVFCLFLRKDHNQMSESDWRTVFDWLQREWDNLGSCLERGLPWELRAYFENSFGLDTMSALMALGILCQGVLAAGMASEGFPEEGTGANNGILGKAWQISGLTTKLQQVKGLFEGLDLKELEKRTWSRDYWSIEDFKQVQSKIERLMGPPSEKEYSCLRSLLGWIESGSSVLPQAAEENKWKWLASAFLDIVMLSGKLTRSA